MAITVAVSIIVSVQRNLFGDNMGLRAYLDFRYVLVQLSTPEGSCRTRKYTVYLKYKFYINLYIWKYTCGNTIFVKLKKVLLIVAFVEVWQTDSILGFKNLLIVHFGLKLKEKFLIAFTDFILFL